MPVKRPPPDEASFSENEERPAFEDRSDFHDDNDSDGSVFGSPSSPKKQKGGKHKSSRVAKAEPWTPEPPSSAMSTPKGGKNGGTSNKADPPSSKEFGPEHVAQLNLAVRDLWSSSSGMVLDAYPLLAPYKAKGRIHRHFHALLNAAPGGPEGLKMFESYKKANASTPGTSSGGGRTPKKAKREE